MSNIDKLLNYINNDKEILCYGAGKYAHELFGYLQSIGRYPQAFVVTDISKNGTKMFDRPIISIDRIKNSENYNWIVSVHKVYREEIIKELRHCGVNTYFLVEEDFLEEVRFEVTKKNNELKNIATKDRCFILGSGASLNQQNLGCLNAEDVFMCSFLGLMDSYREISPKYHVWAAAYNDGGMDTVEEKERYSCECYSLLNEIITSEYVVLDYYDRPYVEYLNVLNDKKVYYLFQDVDSDERPIGFFDLTKVIPAPSTAVSMMLKLAMYMGYKKIYLLGCDFSIGKNGYYNAYNLMDVKGYDYLKELYSKAIYWDNETPLRILLRAQLTRLEEYHYIHNVAQFYNVEIYNATLGGDLDEFERVDFDSLFRK